MDTLFFVLGGLLDLAAWIWITVIAFRQGGILWGIGSLITGGLIGFVFGVINWGKISTWWPLILWIGGLVCIYVIAPLFSVIAQ